MLNMFCQFKSQHVVKKGNNLQVALIRCTNTFYTPPPLCGKNNLGLSALEKPFTRIL